MPTKKHPSARARANRASTAATLTTTDDGPPEKPDLPEDRDWHRQTTEWWDDLWRSPMANEYHASDRHALFVLATLVDDFWREPSVKAAAEIRLQRQAFGLTPYDRRRLEWTIETAEESKAKGRRRQRDEVKPPPASPGDDPRSALYAVT